MSIKLSPKRALDLLMLDSFDKELLISNQGELENLLYFVLNDVNFENLDSEITSLSKREKQIVFKNAMEIYPLSGKIVTSIINSNDFIDASRIVELYDVSMVMVRNMSRMSQLIAKGTREIPDKIIAGQNAIEKLKDEIKRSQQQIEEFKNTTHINQELKNEVDNLAYENEELEKSYSKEILESLKQEHKNRQSELKKLEAEQNKEIELIENIKKQFDKKSKNSDNGKALKQISKLIKAENKEGDC